MNWKSFVAGAVVGLASGYVAWEMVSQKKKISPEKVLHNVKKQFKQHGPINGSWIHMKPEDYEKRPLTYLVYKGGVSRTDKGQTEQFEFIADASTGSILDIQKLPQD